MILPINPEVDIQRRADDLLEALQSDHIVFQNEDYKMGDTVALLTICAWIESKYGPKQFYLTGTAKHLPILQQIITGSIQFKNAGDAPGTAKMIDDIDTMFWYYNDLFQHEGFRLSAPSYVGLYPIVFAPLLEVDYHYGRRMSPTFCLELAYRLSLAYPGRVLVLADQLSSHDLEFWRLANCAKVLAAPTAEVCQIIAGARVFIGGDTGLSHIAGCFDINQVAIYSRQVEEDQRKRDVDKERGQIFEKVSGYRTTYNAWPNKRTAHCTQILMERGGTFQTINDTMFAVRYYMGEPR